MVTWEKLHQSISSVIKGQDELVKKILCCMGAGGHLLLEDYPGTGKTTLAKALAASVSGSVFQRIQFTPDLLPSDILGVSILDPRTAEFEFKKGPIFSNILLADEINRASPRTQSALLEVMAEKQATIEGVRYDFTEMFFVIATQNPVEFRGTFPLPEAQMDRFAMQCSLGYVSIEDEVSILTDQQSTHHPIDSLTPVITMDEIQQFKKDVANVQISEELKNYIVHLVSATRDLPDVKLAASPRASLALMKVSQALSLIRGKGFVTPDVIKDCAKDVIAHRLILDSDAAYSGQNVRTHVQQLLDDVPVPA
ncbi:MAG: MoxR-like ATPase [Cryomorphaceae bacterium]|jgi:MoxR-like ATPase